MEGDVGKHLDIAGKDTVPLSAVVMLQKEFPKGTVAANLVAILCAANTSRVCAMVGTPPRVLRMMKQICNLKC